MNKQHTNIFRILAVFATAVFLYNGSTQVLAQTPSPTGDAKTTPSLEETADDRAQIEELKERLATKVAELRTLVKRAMHGTVKSVSIASATVETVTKDIKIELDDDVKVAQIIKGKRTSLATDKIEVDDTITVFGTYDATLDLLQAQYIFIENTTKTRRVLGTVSDIDKEKNMITIKTQESGSVDADIERTTKTSSWTKDDGVVKSGFSKLNIGDYIHLVGTPDEKNENLLSAIRILNLGDLSGKAPTPTSEATSTPEATDSATP